MPIGPQPRGRRGTVERPYSPLNLRLALASFALVGSVAVAILCWRLGAPVLMWLSIGIAVLTVPDLIVVQMRRRARRREDPEDHSLFE